MKIGNIIKQLRKAKGFTQTSFAELCGISTPFLSQIESDKRYPHPNTLKSICDNLDIPEQVLIFMSLDAKSIPPEKQEIFDIMFPTLKSFIGKIFPVINNIED